MKIKVKINRFQTSWRPFLIKTWLSLKVKFQMVQKLSGSQGIKQMKTEPKKQYVSASQGGILKHSTS